MPKFAYVALGPDGAVVKGVQVADDRAQAQLALRQRQLLVTELAPRRTLTEIEVIPARIKRPDLMHLSRQLAAFLRAGIPIVEAIGVLADDDAKPLVRKVLTEIRDDIHSGLTLMEAVNRHPRHFPVFYRGILASAELTGRLDTVLDQLAVYLERDMEARRKIKSALIYPAVVAGLSLCVVVVLSVFVLPKFRTFFTGLNAQLPLPTRILLGATSLVEHWWWAGALGLLAVVLFFLGAVRTRRGRRLRDRIVLRIPVFGTTLRYALIERFTRILASMVSAGVPLPEAMAVATDSLRNLVFEDALDRARVAMLEGLGFADPIAATGLFPGVAAQMMRVGESTGTIEVQLQVAATFYERELDYKIQKVTSLFEPLVIITMGGLVGFVAVAMVSAMYGIFRAARLG
jgi:type IV pilus assembly protein PilC